MKTKEFITPKQLYDDSFTLGHKILASGYRPDVLVAIWRGGTPVGSCVEEYLRIQGVQTNHYPIKTSAYNHDELRRDIRVEMLELVAERVSKETNLLIVDDVFDTGKSVAEVISELEKLKLTDTPSNIKVATLHYKPGKNQTSRQPDYFMHEKPNDTWLVYPHELEELTPEELSKYRSVIAGKIEKP